MCVLMVWQKEKVRTNAKNINEKTYREDVIVSVIMLRHLF